MFSSPSAITASGTLSYTPAANANGDATITVTLSDNGGTANGGVDESAEQSFTIEVIAVNDPPVVGITAPADGTVFNYRDNIAFAGTATDPEDGDLSASISWSSDLDGRWSSTTPST